MTLDDQDRSALIKYRIEKARKAVDDVRFLIDNNRLHLAVNRIYVLRARHSIQFTKNTKKIKIIRVNSCNSWASFFYCLPFSSPPPKTFSYFFNFPGLKKIIYSY